MRYFIAEPSPIMRVLTLCILLFSALLAPLLVAPAVSAQGLNGLKIGIVNINEALNRSAAGERSKNILLTNKGQLENELKAKDEQLKKKREALQSNIMLSQEARATREAELKQEEATLRREVQKAQRDLQDKERKLTESIFIELRTVIDEIGKEEQYDLILEKNAAGVILFTTAKLEDLTDKVIERYNSFNKAKK